MKRSNLKLLLFFVSIIFSILAKAEHQATSTNQEQASDTKGEKVLEMYQTTTDRTKLFSSEKVICTSKTCQVNGAIKLDPTIKFQEMDGFGAAITGSTCFNLLKMTPENRAAILKEVFDPQTGLGYSYIRVSIGCSDFSVDEYTCCDKPGIQNFGMPEFDKRDLYPILHEILDINPKIKILGSPWTCPRWMKIGVDNDQPYNIWTSGRLNPLYYADYANYFVLWIQEMEKQGFPIESITIQNEPLNKGNSVSLYMTWEEQRDFIKNNLGPAFKKAGIDSKIFVFDHNYNYDDIPSQQNYVTKIYNDPDAAQYIDGSAWHAYGGSVTELDKVHAAAPDKNIYFTEMSIGSWGYTFEDNLMWDFKEICLGTINRFCKAVIVWNLMLDADHGPSRPNGCNTCYGVIDIDKDYQTMKKNSHYYTIGHLSKVIKPGAVRIGSSLSVANPDIYFSAFVNPDGSSALVLQNDSKTDLSLAIEGGNRSFVVLLPAKSLTSLRW